MIAMRRKAEDFILDYLQAGPDRSVDVLDSDFVDAFIAHVGCAFTPTLWGAYKCRYLGQTLTRMYRQYDLKRHRVGLSSGAWRPGFPTWVYVYTSRHRLTD